MIKKVIIFVISVTLFLTTMGCLGELKTYDTFSEERIEILEDFYLLTFPDNVKYEMAVFENVRDTSFRLVLEYSHNDFSEFIKTANTTYMSTEGQNFGIFSATHFNYNSTPFYSQESQTYICYSTNNGIEYVELYSTRYFENINKFNKF